MESDPGLGGSSGFYLAGYCKHTVVACFGVSSRCMCRVHIRVHPARLFQNGLDSRCQFKGIAVSEYLHAELLPRIRLQPGDQHAPGFRVHAPWRSDFGNLCLRSVYSFNGFGCLVLGLGTSPVAQGCQGYSQNKKNESKDAFDTLGSLGGRAATDPGRYERQRGRNQTDGENCRVDIHSLLILRLRVIAVDCKRTNKAVTFDDTAGTFEYKVSRLPEGAASEVGRAGCESRGGDLPDQVEVDVEATVDDAVAQSDGLAPWDLGISVVGVGFDA